MNAASKRRAQALNLGVGKRTTRRATRAGHREEWTSIHAYNLTEYSKVATVITENTSARMTKHLLDCRAKSKPSAPAPKKRHRR